MRGDIGFFGVKVVPIIAIFFKYNFIGIGYNEISIKDLTFADEKTVSTHIKSKLSISGKADKSGYAASQMIRFVHGLKKRRCCYSS